MTWLPSANALVMKVAWPLAFSAVGPARVAAPSLKVTVPLAPTATPLLVTVAVKVTELLGAVVKEGFGVEVSSVAVV